jgi:hypothetical protein
MRRIGAVLLGLALMLSACEPGRSTRTAPAPEQQQVRSARPRCGVIDIGSSDYDWTLRPRVASPGQEVVISGPTLRSEGGRWTSARKFEFWFNTKIPPTETLDASPLAPGPIVLLATVHDLRRCAFKTSFRVPDVPSGRYRVAGFAYEREELGFLLPHVLTVTEPST